GVTATSENSTPLATAREMARASMPDCVTVAAMTGSLVWWWLDRVCAGQGALNGRWGSGEHGGPRPSEARAERRPTACSCHACARVGTVRCGGDLCEHGADLLDLLVVPALEGAGIHLVGGGVHAAGGVERQESREGTRRGSRSDGRLLHELPIGVQRSAGRAVERVVAGEELPVSVGAGEEELAGRVNVGGHDVGCRAVELHRERTLLAEGFE